MLKLTTQDGRTLEISRNHHLFISGSYKGENSPAKLTVTTFNKVIKHFSDGSTYETGDGVIERYGIIGNFSTDTAFQNSLNALHEAWNNGATEFTVPQDSPFKSMVEQFDDFCEENHLICVSINELGYKLSDLPRNIHIWKTTSDFERRNILVADPTGTTPADVFGGVYAKSLAKWQAIKITA